jgi:ABC-type branched-subunit amino acid transport system substrate-binding protein
MAAAGLVLALLAMGCGRSGSADGGGTTTTTGGANAKCAGATLEAGEIGVSPTDITVEVMADTGSPLAPGLFQGNVDAMQAFAKWVNANGGIGCRQLKVVNWDSKLDPTEAKNGIINACQTSLAMVGGNALFNPDSSVLTGCADKAGQPVGLPDIAALAADINEQCNKNVWNMQSVSEPCTTTTGVRDLKVYNGTSKYFLSLEPKLQGVYLVPGDLPTTVSASTYIIDSMRKAGITITDALKVSGRSEQSAYTVDVQAAKAGNANWIYDGSNDVAMIKMRKEAAAQGLTTVKYWTCSIACYTENFKAEGAAVDGTYVTLNYLPFEETDTNQALKDFSDSVGGKPDSFGASAWQSGMLFKEVIDRIVAADGPNAITRAKVISTMMSITDFTADGWIAPKGPKSVTSCYVVMQINGGKFTRKFPETPGTMECTPQDIVTITMDPQAEAAKLS